MKKNFLLLAVVIGFVIPVSLKAQNYFLNNKYYENDFLFEFGGSIGAMNCLTDLGGKKGIGKRFIKDLNLKNSKACFSAYGVGMYKNVIGFRIEGTFGNVTAYDSILKSVRSTTFGRYERNLSFKSSIIDLQLAAEIHPFFGPWLEEDPPFVSPYIIAGIGLFSFNPKAKLNGTWYDLQPLNTEGQSFTENDRTKPYNLKQINIPVGAGVKYELSPVLNTRLEIVYRILCTDYLDDISTVYADPTLFAANLPPGQATIARQLADRQGEIIAGHITTPGAQRGNPKDNDAFFSIQLKIGLIINREKRRT